MAVSSVSGEAMMQLLPPMYADSRVMQDLMQAVGVELDAIHAASEDIKAQTRARTATWCLDRWETQLGLPVDPSLTDAERQDKIVSRLRGHGTATVLLVQKVAESFKYGSIDVVEDHPTYNILVSFLDRTGVPTNQADLQAAVRAVVPAHLAVVYRFNWFTFLELRAEAMTFAAMGAKGLTFAQWTTYK